MAGEYSRELSVKVFAGQRRQVERGFHRGGSAGYGLRRQLVALDGTPKGTMDLGQWKSLTSDRVILVPGPNQEVAVVASIYETFISRRMNESEIAKDLNQRGLKTASGKAWSRSDVHMVLVSPKYIGQNVFNRFSIKLGQKKVKNGPEQWITCKNASHALVSSEDFEKVQAIIRGRSCPLEPDVLIDKLHALLLTAGRLTTKIINTSPGMPKSSTYCKRFGGLGAAYALAGWKCDRDLSFVDDSQKYRTIRATLSRLHPAERFGLRR